MKSKTVTATKKAAPRRKPGRPSVLTSQLTAKIAKAVQDGLYLESACAMHDVGRSTVYRWLELANGADGTEPDPLYVEFRDTIDKAAARHQHRLIKRVEAGKFGWQGSLAILGLRHQAQWSQKVREARHDGANEVLRRLAEALSPVDYAKVVAAYTGAVTAPEQRPPVEDLKALMAGSGQQKVFVVRIKGDEHGPPPDETEAEMLARLEKAHDDYAAERSCLGSPYSTDSNPDMCRHLDGTPD